jgi:hypothetical protein
MATAALAGDRQPELQRAELQQAGARHAGPQHAGPQQAGPPIAPYADFCNRIGIRHYKRGTSWTWYKPWSFPKTDVDPDVKNRAHPLEARSKSLYWQILRAYQYHTLQYWLVASVINTLYLAQIAIGATATALGSAGVSTRPTTGRTTAITILTAIGTVIAGVLAFMKSRGQPNRVRQLRNDLRRACDEVLFWEAKFGTNSTDKDVKDAIDEVKALYDRARANTETNYPDTWSTSANTSHA